MHLGPCLCFWGCQEHPGESWSSQRSAVRMGKGLEGAHEEQLRVGLSGWRNLRGDSLGAAASSQGTAPNSALGTRDKTLGKAGAVPGDV